MSRDEMISMTYKIFDVDSMDYNKRMEFSALMSDIGNQGLRRYLIRRAVRNRGKRTYEEVGKQFSITKDMVKHIVNYNFKRT